MNVNNQNDYSWNSEYNMWNVLGTYVSIQKTNILVLNNCLELSEGFMFIEGF